MPRWTRAGVDLLVIAEPTSRAGQTLESVAHIGVGPIHTGLWGGRPSFTAVTGGTIMLSGSACPSVAIVFFPTKP